MNLDSKDNEFTLELTFGEGDFSQLCMTYISCSQIEDILVTLVKAFV